MVLSPSERKQNRTKGEGEDRSDIEDLAFRNRPSKEPDRLECRRRAPIEHDLVRVLKLILTVNKVQGFELIGRSFASAEKDGEGMGLKSRPKRKYFPSP